MHFLGFEIWHEFWMARASKRRRRLWDTYSFPGFRAEPMVCGIFGDPKARVITLKRRSKKRHADAAVAYRWAGTTASSAGFAICPAGTRVIFLELEVRRVDCRSCGKVKRERLDFLADNPLYTKRFAYFVGRRCRQATISGRGEGTGAGLAHGQGAGDAIHAGPARARGHAGAAGDRHRRDLDPQGPHLPDRGQRPAARPADLVWRQGPFGGEHERSSTPGSARRRVRAFAWP